MSPFGHKADDEQATATASGTALVTQPLRPDARTGIAVTVELGDGRTACAMPTINGGDYYSVINIGARIPVRFPRGDPAKAVLDTDHVPTYHEIRRVIQPALGGPKVDPLAPDEWRVGFAMRYAERLIAEGDVSVDQAHAIRSRVRAGV